jgi:hypothetical protein
MQLGSCIEPLTTVSYRQPRDNTILPEDEEYERAEKAILDAITNVEKKVQTAIEAEVDTLFLGYEGHSAVKADVAAKARKAVQGGVSVAKRSVDDHAERHAYPFEKDHPFPYAHPLLNAKQDPSHHRERRILHAVESAEKAVLSAIQSEVETLFPPTEHHDKDPKVHAKISSGVQQASAKVKDMQDHRRDWLDRASARIDDYMSQEYFLE